MEKKIRNKILYDASTTKVPTGCGNIYITIGKQDGEVFEMFAHLGKAGGCSVCQNEALTRMITLALRYSIPVSEMIEELENISCPNMIWDDGIQIKSCPDAIAKVLAKEVKNETSTNRIQSS